MDSQTSQAKLGSFTPFRPNFSAKENYQQTLLREYEKRLSKEELAISHTRDYGDVFFGILKKEYPNIPMFSQFKKIQTRDSMGRKELFGVVYSVKQGNPYNLLKRLSPFTKELIALTRFPFESRLVKIYDFELKWDNKKIEEIITELNSYMPVSFEIDKTNQ